MAFTLETKVSVEWVCDQCGKSLKHELTPGSSMLPLHWGAVFVFFTGDHGFPRVGEPHRCMMGGGDPKDRRWTFPPGVLPSEGRFILTCDGCSSKIDLFKVKQLPPESAPETPVSG